MRKFKLSLCLFLALLTLLLSACGKEAAIPEPPEEPPFEIEETPLSLQLLFCSTDTLNPYKTKNRSNLELSTLLFDPLVSVSNGFKPIFKLAESVTVEGKVCTVKLRSVVFSDNNPVTADDIVSSYNLAKNSDLFSHLFYEVTSVTAADSKTVVFSLKRNDPFFANMLTFPIIRKGTEDLKNEDNVELTPIGCGRFVFSEADSALVASENYYEKVSVSKITLVDAPDTESFTHYVEIGATDFYSTDPANGNIIRMSGKKTSLNMNNLVYLGINHNYGPLSSLELRQAISSALDRTVISEKAFYNYAEPATGFFHPAFSDTKGYQTLQPNADTKISIENIEKIGYNSLDNNGYRYSSNGTALRLSLLVNNTNTARVAAANIIKEQLSAVGIALSVNAVSNEQYFSMLSSGNFQLYIGEVQLPNNMDIGQLVLSGGTAAYGIKPIVVSEEKGSLSVGNYDSVINGYYEGKNSISEVSTALTNYLPVIPVLYRNKLLFYSDRITNIENVSSGDIFLSLNNINQGGS